MTSKHPNVEIEIELTDRGRRWVELIEQEGLTPEEALDRVNKEWAAKGIAFPSTKERLQ